MSPHKPLYAIVPAAGSGVRMGGFGSHPKVFLPLLEGRSVVECVLDSLIASEVVSGIVVVTQEAERDLVFELFERRMGDAVELLWAAGGATRQESVFNGLALCSDKAQYVLIHDGARPCCPITAIRAVAEAGMHSGAALLALPVRATIKRSRDGNTVDATAPRAELWEAQTPQVFSWKILYEAHLAARRDNYEGTDDSELVERSGRTVDLVLGSYQNIKVTTPEDLDLARTFMAAQR